MFWGVKYIRLHCVLKFMSLGGVAVLFISSIILYKYAYEPSIAFINNKNTPGQIQNVDMESEAMSEYPQKKSLIILAYWRGGSTFLGKIIDQHSDVFYFFEPLIGHMKFRANDSMTLHFVDGSVKTYRSWQRHFIERDFLEYILSCQLEKLSMEILTYKLIRLGKLTEPYLSCLGNHTSPKIVAKCLPYLKTACMVSSFIAMKVLRINMVTVTELLDRNENLKAIHLVRDPRGILMSRRISDGMEYIATQQVVELCADMARNHFDAEVYSLQHPGRIKLVRYEDLARYPLPVSKDIYNFSGLSFDSYVKDYVQEITSYDLKDKPDPPTCYLCVVKTNSTRTAFKWRKHIRSEKAKEVDGYCKNIYSLFGYRQLNEYQLRRAAFSTMVDRHPLIDAQSETNRPWGMTV